MTDIETPWVTPLDGKALPDGSVVLRYPPDVRWAKANLTAEEEAQLRLLADSVPPGGVLLLAEERPSSVRAKVDGAHSNLRRA